MENSTTLTHKILTPFNYLHWRVDMDIVFPNNGLYMVTMGVRKSYHIATLSRNTYDTFICFLVMFYGPNLGYVGPKRYFGGFGLINAPNHRMFGQLAACVPSLMTFKSLRSSHSLK